MMRHRRIQKPKSRAERIGGGLMLILVGLGGWAVQTGYLELRELVDFWPLLVVVHGIEQLIAGRRAWGFFALLLGASLLHPPWRTFVVQDGWPLLLIVTGLGLTVGALLSRQAREETP